MPCLILPTLDGQNVENNMKRHAVIKHVLMGNVIRSQTKPFHICVKHKKRKKGERRKTLNHHICVTNETFLTRSASTDNALGKTIRIPSTISTSPKYVIIKALHKSCKTKNLSHHRFYWTFIYLFIHILTYEL